MLLIANDASICRSSCREGTCCDELETFDHVKAETTYQLPPQQPGFPQEDMMM